MHILLNESKDGVKSCSCLRCKTDELEGLEGTGAVPVHKGSRLMQRGRHPMAASLAVHALDDPLIF